MVKAFIVSPRRGDDAFARELQEFARTRLEPARVSAPGGVRRRAAQDARRQGQPQGAARCARRGDSVPSSPRRTIAHDTPQLFPKITDQGLDDLRRRIGVPITDTLEPWCYEATRDNIRHYAHGIGDDNPLWCDPGLRGGHALRRRHRAAELPVRARAASSPATSAGCPGVHAMWAGADWTWHQPVRRNDEITTEAWLKDLVEHQTRFAGRAIQQIYHVDFSNQRGELRRRRPIAGASAPSATTRASRAPSTRGEGASRRGATPTRSWREIYALYASEEVRGADAALLART